MILGIDASNIKAGGGVTHLAEILNTANPFTHGFSQVLVWSCESTLARIEEKSWLTKCHEPMMEKPLPFRVFWQRFRLSKIARDKGCDILFVPGGSYAADFRPVVTMSRNMLPFEWRELKRYRLSVMALKLMLLRWTQSFTFRNADGLIFLSHYAHRKVMQVIKTKAESIRIIPHGINKRFIKTPREQKPISNYSDNNPYRILYVSIVEVYKHQWHVAEAVAQLRKKGLPIMLELVGPAYHPALKRLNKTLDTIDPNRNFVRYIGNVPHRVLNDHYLKADLCLFASSCENMPNILLEGMASGLPIACSNRGPMPEIIEDAGSYFDPENPDDIACSLYKLIESVDLRTRLANESFHKVRNYSWRRCADQTFAFLVRVADGNSHSMS